VQRLLTPRWIAGHVLAVIGIVVFVLAGFWQLRRLDERRTFNAAVEAAIATPATDLDSALAADGEYVRVELDGRFDTSHETLVLRSRGGTSGHHVLTPFLLDDGRGVLVDRGWVPIDYDTTPVMEAPPPQGRVTVEGILWPAQSGGVPDELPTVVRRIDPAIVDPFVDADLIDSYLLLEAPVTADLPIPADTPELNEGSHLSYAVQWFLFGAVVVVGYPILLRRTLGATRR
jgi:cytochrome oxidase assembly protein ShyY1